MKADGSMDEADWKKLREQVTKHREQEEARRKNSVANRLHKKLNECGFHVDKPVRLRPGHWQRSSGAWVWMAMHNEAAGCHGWIGSQDTMANCAKMTNEELKAEIDSYPK